MVHKFKEDLDNAKRNIQIADHLIYITFPLINERRLLLKIFEDIHKSIINCINAVLNYEYLYKKIVLYKDSKENFRTFFNKCAKNYDLNNYQIKKILELLELNKKHKQSAMEFPKKEKIIILSDNLKTEYLNLQKIKDYLLLAKEIYNKINKKLKFI